MEGVAVMGVGPGVDDDGVIAARGLLDGIDEGPLRVALEKGGGVAPGGGGVTNKFS